MNFKEEDLLLEKIKNQIDQQLEPDSVTAFDADGTLWAEDVNNLFLNYQESHNLRKLSDLLGEYYSLGENRHKRCEEFACRQEGFSLEELRKQSREALAQNPIEVFPFQKKLFSYLKEKNISIYIVTASLKWLVEEAVNFYDLPVDKVLGVETVVENGMITSKLISPITYGTGKAKSFLKNTNGKSPLLSAGNSPSDLSLLEMSPISLVVQSASSKNENYQSEQKMNPIVEKNNWHFFKVES